MCCTLFTWGCFGSGDFVCKLYGGFAFWFSVSVLVLPVCFVSWFGYCVCGFHVRLGSGK